MMKTIVLSEYGIRPGTDCASALTRLFKQNPENCEFVFEPGDYPLGVTEKRRLFLSNTDVIPERSLGLVLENMKNIRFSGNGARFLCAGRTDTCGECERQQTKDHRE